MSIKGIKIGSNIVFSGYAEDVPKAERLLTADTEYAVVEVDLKEKKVSVEIDNPDYNAKKKVSDTNAKTLLVEVFEEEFTLPETETPAPTKGKAAAAKAPAAKAAPAKAAAPAAKGKPAKAAPVEDEEAAPEDGIDSPLAEEDADIVKLVDEAEDILTLATELVEESAANDYRLGGVLYHIRLDKSYERLSRKYKENGGFELYVQEKLNMEYRKAMALVQIYYATNRYGADAAKIIEMGWSKAWKIAQVMDDDNVKELVKLGSTSTVADLSETIKVSYKEHGGVKGDKKKLFTFKFRLFEDSAEVVTAAINACAASLGYERLDQAFEHIITEWATEHPMKGVKVPAKKVATQAAPAAKATAKSAAKPAVRSAARR